MQGLAPKNVKICSCAFCVLQPVGAHCIVGIHPLILRTKCRHYFVRRHTTIKRSNQRLNNGCGTVVRARVTPRFEIVRLVQMPSSKPRRFVMELSQMDVGRHLLHRLIELNVGWS